MVTNADQIATAWPLPDLRAQRLARVIQGGAEPLAAESLRAAQKHIDWCEAAGLTVSK